VLRKKTLFLTEAQYSGIKIPDQLLPVLKIKQGVQDWKMRSEEERGIVLVPGNIAASMRLAHVTAASNARSLPVFTISWLVHLLRTPCRHNKGTMIADKEKTLSVWQTKTC